MVRNLPATILLVSVVVGALLDKKKLEIRTVELQVEDQELAIKKLNRINEALKSDKFRIEQEVVTHLRTANNFFDLAQSLESTDLKEVCDAFVMIVCEQLGIKNCYLYLNKSDDLELVASIDDAGESLPASISLRNEIGKYPIIKAAVNSKQLIRYEDIEKGASTEEFEFGAVSPLIGFNGAILGLIAIRRIEFLDYLPMTFSNLRGISDWSSTVLARVRRDNIASENTFRESTTGMLTNRYFHKRIRKEILQARHFKIPLTVLEIQFPSIESLRGVQLNAMHRIIASRLQKIVRDIDEITLGAHPVTYNYIVHPEDVSDIEDVIVKISEEISSIEMDLKDKFDFYVEIQAWSLDDPENSLELFVDSNEVA